LADNGYDRDVLGEAVEWDSRGRRTGKRFPCPQIHRRGNRNAAPLANVCGIKRVGVNAASSLTVRAGVDSLLAAAARSSHSMKWFKNLFDLHEHVWHRHLDNNRTQLLAALFAYQTLLRYNRRIGRPNGQVQWILKIPLTSRTPSGTSSAERNVLQPHCFCKAVAHFG
jgi:hypothetical protein